MCSIWGATSRKHPKHVEVPHKAPATLGEFLREYAMIVLSILTALGLEHFLVDMQNHSDALRSKARIEAELAANMHELQSSSSANLQSNKAASELLRALVEHLKAGKPIDAKIEALMEPGVQNFQVSVPSWRRSAWDGAIADQSAGHLEPLDLQRYSEIYATAADMSGTWQILLGGEWLTHATELLLDIRLGKVEARPLAITLMRYLLAEQQIQQMESDLAALIKNGNAGHASSPSSSSR